MIARHDTTGGGGADRSVDNVVWQRSQCVVLPGRRGCICSAGEREGDGWRRGHEGQIGDCRVQQVQHCWASKQLVGEVQEGSMRDSSEGAVD